jgi:type IVB pilus formation R64 PilN family outer membrane protein
LDQVSSRFGIWWKYKAGVITFYEMETRTFMVYALPTESSMSSSISSSGSEGGSGSASSSADSSATMNAWDQIQETIQNMLPSSAKMSVSPTSGIITITAPPDTLRKVGKYVRDINEKMSRQVAVTVRLIRVTLDKSHQYGLDLNAAFNNGKYNWSTTTVGATQASSGEGAIAQTLSFGILGHGKFVGTQGVIQALSRQGDASLVTTATVTTMNNKTAPIQISGSRDYISKMETTITDNNTTTSVDTDTINYGFNMNILPRILDHGRLMMFFTMTLSDLIALTPSTVTGSEGNTSMSLPQMETKGFSQEVILRSGSTLVIAGFEEMKSTMDKTGVGHVDNPIGGGFASDDKRTVLVILVTPEVLVSPLSPETRVNDM